MKIITLIRATFRELFSKATLYVLLGISTLVMLGTLASVSAEHTDDGVILKAFGNPVSPPTPLEEIEQLVFGMQTGLAKGLFIGIMLFGVFATAGIIPDSLEKGTVDLYLSKPLSRWELLFGKYCGAVAVMLAVILYFIGGIWLGFGVRTGVWNLRFLLSSFTMSFMFACIFSIVVFLGVVFRNAAIPIIGCFIYLMVVDNVLESRETFLSMLSDRQIYHTILDALYYIFPQVSGMQKSLANQIQHNDMEWKYFIQAFLSSSAIFGGAVLVLRRKDF
jgi:ABC-type transport system involved in multi-copper enzyme maturation permease subunit